MRVSIRGRVVKEIIGARQKIIADKQKTIIGKQGGVTIGTLKAVII